MTYLGLLLVGLHVVMIISIQPLGQGKTVVLSGYQGKAHHLVDNNQQAVTNKSGRSRIHTCTTVKRLDSQLESDGRYFAELGQV